MPPYTIDNLKWAINNLGKRGTSDLLPPYPHFDAIRGYEEQILRGLGNLSFKNHRFQSPQLFLVPKTDYSYRVTLDLDPLDHIILSAATCNRADDMERNRIPENANIVFSHRVDVGEHSLFKASKHGEFQDFNIQLAESGRYSHVLVIDLFDCFHQISTHRVCNALEECGMPVSDATTFERAFHTFNNQHSRGVPVGQDFSRLLAEISLDTIDKWLLRRGAVFTRYVDDYRIFFTSWNEMLLMLHEINHYLQQPQLRLSLNDAKTRTYRSETFVREEARDPERVVKDLQGRLENAKLEDLSNSLQETFSAYGIPEDPPMPTTDLLIQIRDESFEEAVVSMFDVAVGPLTIDAHTLRYLFRILTYFESALLVDRVLENFSRLIPVLPAVCRYYISVYNQTSPDQDTHLLKVADSDVRANLPYVREWLAYVFRTIFAKDEDALALLHKWGSREAHFLYQALYLSEDSNHIREVFVNWRALDNHSRRWLIKSLRHLPTGERRAQIREIKLTGDLIDSAIAHSAN